MELLAFAGTATLIVISPGPDLAMVLRGALGGSRQDGILIGLGIAVGSAVWAAGAAVGLATVMTAFPAIVTAIRWFGAAYLAWLGVRTLLATRSFPSQCGEQAAAPVRRSAASSFRTGLAGNLLHPGQVFFFSSMLPQFVDPTGDPGPQVLVLGCVFVAIVLVWFSGVAVIAAGMRRDRWGKMGPVLARISGVVFIGFAVRLWAGG